jgi:hypothetical protein
MPPGIKEFLDQCTVISQVPLPFATVCILAIIGIWVIAKAIYSSRLDGKTFKLLFAVVRFSSKIGKLQTTEKSLMGRRQTKPKLSLMYWRPASIRIFAVSECQHTQTLVQIGAGIRNSGCARQRVY